MTSAEPPLSTSKLATLAERIRALPVLFTGDTPADAVVSYARGHREAREAAAELTTKLEAENLQLRAENERLRANQAAAPAHAIKPADIGQGWKLLVVGEARQLGDQYKYCDEPWEPVPAKFFGWEYRADEPPVRRRVEGKS